MSSADRLGAFGTSVSWLRTWPRRYSLAVFVVAFATLVRYALELHLGPFPPFLLFVPAIIVVAVLGSRHPGHDSLDPVRCVFLLDFFRCVRYEPPCANGRSLTLLRDRSNH